ncbi:ubiquinol-cytochrome c reductase iron-sulfur subunit [Sulfuriflexus mobilis]|uniref:ubiquinol-cytochrome c reductase iron-sulfur subunit n=1 Tax=Sulfuriflexus mobilis TaxID=1811807 RepID=UPI000F827D12|nr:ubiquinol-cytochrome c reductase iron-sulfur subunit [Sulfuriflexus mobilis]
MSTDGVDKSKRRFLTAATTVVGGVGAAFVAVPFLKSWSPSAKARAAGAPVEVDFSKLQPGQQMAVLWQKKPVWIVRRTQETLASLASNRDHLADPDSAQSKQPEYIKGDARALNPEYLVTVGICTHLGCSPTYRPELVAADLGDDWMGGFFCPCHGSKFDMSGRVYAGVPAPTNLEVPKYKYLSDTSLIIGVDEGAA